MNVRVNVGVGLKPNSIGRATVKNVKYDPCEKSTIGRQQIVMETTDGDRCEWDINWYCTIRKEEFEQTREDILSGRITSGTEVDIIYNPIGILAFGLWT